MARTEQNFMPDLCNARSLFALVLVGELLALALSIADHGLSYFSWVDFAMVSIFIQWVVLTSAACICPLRPWFERKGDIWGGVVSYLIILGMTVLFSVMGHWSLERNLNLNGYSILGNVIIASIFAGILLRYFYIQQQLRNQQQAELHARVQALQSRIRPHFLFNSMNSIASLIDINPDLAEKMVVDLSELFRASLTEASLVPMNQEIKLCEQFISIEQIRLGERLYVEWDCDDFDDTVKVPSLLIQPLIENAIYHGIQPLANGGTVNISVKVDNGLVNVKVCNPVLSKSDSPLLKNIESTVHVESRAEEKIERRARPRKSNGMALSNIRHRLEAYYGHHADLNVEATPDSFNVTVTYPIAS